MKAAILNPIRFYKTSNVPNYTTKFPNPDNVTFGSQYFYGVNFSSWFIRFHIGIMYLQFEMTGADSKVLSVYKYVNGAFQISATIYGADITPSGWSGNYMYKFTVNLSDGVYYLSSTNGFKSDIFCVTSSAEVSEDFVKIDYLNSENDFGCIFGTNSFTSYFIGSLTPGAPKNEYSTYEDDRGEPVKLSATPQRVATLSLKGLHFTYVDMVNHIFSLDTITVNGIDYENDEAPTFDAIDGSDMGTLNIRLIQKTNDYYYDAD